MPRLQLIFEPSSNVWLNRVDSHALLALIITLNLYLLVLPGAAILDPEDAKVGVGALEISVFAMDATVVVHFAVLCLVLFPSGA